MRATRNATEYPDADRPTATDQDVAEAMPGAAAIVGLVEKFLGARTGS